MSVAGEWIAENEAARAEQIGAPMQGPTLASVGIVAGRSDQIEVARPLSAAVPRRPGWEPTEHQGRG